jgi:PKD repeat protein
LFRISKNIYIYIVYDNALRVYSIIFYILKQLNKIILICFLLPFATNSQIHYYSDCFDGGIVGDGYTAWYTGGISQVSLPVPTGSTIKKAFFFSNIYKWQGSNVPASDKTIEINGQTLVLSEQYNLGNIVYMPTLQSYSSTVIVDITNFINPSISNYVINPFTNVSPVETPLYSDFYILVLYENPTFTTSCIDIYINDKNPFPLLSYLANITNTFDISEQVGLAVHAWGICNNSDDWYEVFINGTSIGEIGGEEDNTDVNCAGVIGSFYYQNGELFGIGNDTGSTTMNGLDAIANIQPYITNQNINVGFEYVSNSSPYSNLINQLFLTYTTPCAPFDVSVSNDTIVCIGEQVQLTATGGASYEWSPATGLSCSDCPNPVFTADSSMFYTVRIWNNDTCSVVRPVKITVKEKPEFQSVYVYPTVCGASTGSASINSAPTGINYSINNGSWQSGGNFGQLGEGNHLIQIEDAFGCQNDTTVYVGTVNNTVANFTVTPQSGSAPLSVAVNNTSQNASNFEWSVNGIIQNNPFNGFTADTSGTYQVMLVAWQHDPVCADTTYATVEVYVYTQF